MWLSLSFLCVWLLIVLIYFPFTIIAKQTAIVPYDESNSSEFAVEENLFEKVVLGKCFFIILKHQVRYYFHIYLLKSIFDAKK